MISHYEFVHIAPGDILREQVRLRTALGQQVQAYIESGQLVPNELVINAVTDTLKENKDAKGFLFDGYPRTRLQAEALDQQLAEQARILHLVLFLQVGNDESYKRIKKRSQEIYRPEDQTDEKIETRFQYYHHDTLPVTDYYKDQKKLIHIPGELDIPTVRGHIKEQLKPYLPRPL